ncbi:MAG: hypothetical protein Q8N18_03330 [Opitutaceae bacterium]|nr:hypothetical protein [Opitutaceae bacterium]
MRDFARSAVAAALLIAAPACLLAQGAADLAPLRPSPKRADPAEPQPADWAAWTAVSRMHGQISFQLEGASEKQTDTTSRKLTSAEWFRARVELELDRDLVTQSPQRRVWRIVRAQGSGGMSGSYEITGTLRSRHQGRTEGEFSGPLGLRAAPALALNLKNGEWEFSTHLGPVTPGTQTTTFNHRDWNQVTADTTTAPWNGALGGHTNFKAVAPRVAIAFGTTASRQLDHPRGLDDLGGRGQSNIRAHAEFWPTLDDVELKVRIADHATWRPRGNIEHPTRPGGTPLSVTAVLRSKASGSPLPPAIRELRFELSDTSREPGVCLNWPLGAKDTAPDLRLAAPPGFESIAQADADGQSVAFTQLMPLPEGPAGEQGGVAHIESYDFGGHSTLRVTARLLDGRTVTGELEEPGGYQTAWATLPYSRGDGWIAESWLKENGHGMREENTDDEDKPDGDGHGGDGFTLYEEYRGWVVDGRHVSGDPKKKELFVMNLGEPALLKGVQLFENLSALKVHRLKAGEMDPGKREMNANRAKGAHRVVQHGIVLRTDLSVRGAQTDMVSRSANDLPGRPKYVKQIRIGPASPPEDILEAGTLASLAGYHEAAVAHELLHAVGVEHHGEGDYGTQFLWRFANDPRSRNSEPFFFVGSLMRPTRVTLSEEDGSDYARKIAPAMEAAKEFYAKIFDAKGRVTEQRAKSSETKFDYTLEQEAEIELNDVVAGMVRRQFVVGEWQGQSSGDSGCVIRYYFSTIYQQQGDPFAYYRVAPQSEPIGHGICRSADGTGINARDRSPQSRYGPAAANRGNCLGQICVNDAIPPKKR